ncbi:TPA: DUF637 domain-containing protein, partial [Acinetobacter baumannii]|nr:DUF637 domain-containing protein [Acinetobacter baumannii]
MSTIIDSVLTSKGNTELYAKDLLTLQGVNATSDQHLAVSSGRTVYSNAEYTPATKWIADKVTNLTSKGVTSVTATGNQVLQNTNLTGGAVLLEAGGFIAGQTGLNLNAVGSDLLKNDTKLNSLNGDLTIQTNSNLTIDPKAYSLKAVGDIELVSKAGTLTLKGYGGTAGNGSEQVVKLDTANGGINLEGAKVDIQGSQLTAQKDIKIVSSKDDVLIDGVKNSLINRKKQEKLNEANNFKKNITDSLALLKSQQFFTDYDNMVTAYEDYTSSNYDYSLYMKHYNLYNDFISKYPVRPNPRLLIFGSDKPLFHSIFSEPQRMTRFDALYSFEPKYDENYLRSLQAEVDFYNTGINGSEHAEAKLNSKSGNINITSAKGLSISGGNISAQTGQVNLEASGVLAEQYKSTINNGANQPPKTLNASVIIDGHTDFYEKGTESEGNYSFRTLVSPTIINGDKGVNIRAVGKTKDDNLVLQATGITSKNGDVKIESNKSILFDAAIEQSYDLTTTTEKKKSWGGLKKKYITTVSENNDTNAASVDISAKNISIETKKLDPSVAAQTPDNNIDIYSGRFTADDGTISIKSGGNLNFYTVEESSSSTVDVTKKTSYSKLISLLGSSKTTTNTTRTQISELPANLKADYINTQAVDKTKLVGTEFEYLKGATIETGGTLELIAAKTSITELLKKEKSSLAWQAMQDKGSITETAQLPSFNGPVLPTFKAAGGLSVQVPISEKDTNKVELRDAILDLSKQPGNEYLKELVNRKDVDWQKVLLTQKDWDYKQQGLTAAGAAIIVIIITIVTMGTGTAAAAGAAGGTAASGTTVGLGASMIGSAGITTTAAGAIVPSTLGAMANAAITSLATQAGVSLINNGGDIGKTLKDLGSKDSVKSLATSIVTAGVLSKIASIDQMKALQETAKSGEFFTNLSGRVGQALVNSTVSASVDTAINGGSLSEKLSASLVAGLSVALQGSLAGEIGENLDLGSKELSDQILHKLAHAAAGCIASSLQEKCEAGAIGAVVGEMVAGSFDMEPENDGDYSQAQLNKVKNVGQLISGVVAASAGYDVTVASQSASTAIENNWGKVLSSTGKAAYKIFKKATELQKAGKNLNDTNVWKDILKDTATGEYQDMLNSFKTAFSAGSTPLERTWALIDLATGIDKKDVKIVQDLLKDRNTIAKRLPNIKNGQFFDDKKIEELANRGDVKKIHQIDVGAKGGWAKQANGKLEGNSAYLLPNGAAYVTDNSGNVKEVTANLRNILMDRNNYQQSIAGKSGISGDQGGHLIAASLGGSGDRINLVPMAKTLNNGSWKAMESELANAVKLGKDVNMKVAVGYPTGSSRPNKFIVTATINGKSTNYQFSQ